MGKLIWWAGLTCVALVAAVTAGRYVGGAKEVKRPDLRADPSSYQFVDASGTGEQVEISFRLINRGQAAVTLTKLERSCSCTAGSDLAGKVVEPGEGYDLRVSTRVPANGVNKDTLWVHHTGGPPLQLTADILGRSDVPHVVGTLPTAYFFGLRSDTPSLVVKVVTCETAGSLPWLDGARSTLPALKVETVEMTERAASHLVVREYQLRLSWLDLPKSKDFTGAVVPKSSVGDQGIDEVKFISIIGTLARNAGE